MVAATQYAVTKIGYEYYILHPSDSSIRYIGSDNSSDGRRALRVIDSNVTNVGIKLKFGNISTNQQRTYSAAFAIVNEERFSINITHISISSPNATYLKIWLHGDRDANANSTTNDPSTVFMWNNNTMVNASNTTAWILAAGNNNPNNMCYNVSDRTNCSTNTTWDETAHVRYSVNNTNARNANNSDTDHSLSNASDFVWVQLTIDIPETVDRIGLHTGTIWIHFESETG